MGITRRPLGVSLLAILAFIAVASYVVLTVLAIAAPQTLRSLLGGLSPQGSGPEMLLSLGALLGVYFAVMAALSALFGYGMWTLRNWARVITIIIAALSLIGTVVSLVQVARDINMSTLLLGGLRVGLCVLVLWYMWTPGVRAAFHGRKFNVTQ